MEKIQKMSEETIKELAVKFAEKNPTFVRQCMEYHFIRWEMIEFSQGKIIKGEIAKGQLKDNPIRP